MRSSVVTRITVIMLATLAGCASPILQLPVQTELYDQVKGDAALAKDFLSCLRQPYEEPQAATAAITPPTQGSGQPAFTAPSLPAVEAAVAESPTLNADEDIPELLTIVRELDNPTRRTISVGRLTRIVEMVKRVLAKFRIDEDRLAQDTSLFAQLLLAYNKAYFGDIQFRAQSPEQGAGIQGVVKVVSAGFVDRNGNASAFPGLSSEITVAVDPAKQQPTVRFHATSVDSRRVASDLVRIFLEAFFDSAFRVPATQEATALKVKWGSNGRTYPRIDHDHPPISYDQFGRVARDAMLAEAIATSAVGRDVRGGGVFGTNNETLAAAIETAGGVIAKKLVEHDAFCYYEVTKGMPVADRAVINGPGPAASSATQ